MSFWNVVTSPSEAREPSFTDSSLPPRANTLEITATTNPPNTGDRIIDTNVPVPSNSTIIQIAASIPTVAGEDIEMVDAEAPAAEPILGTMAVETSPRKSRLANLGLNARPVKFVGWKEPSPGLSVHTPIYAEASPTHQTKSVSQESSDLDELEAMMIPAPLRQAYRERVDISFDSRPQIFKTSKYTTALLTESGVTAIDNPNSEARKTHGPVADATSSTALVDEFVGYDDLPGVLAKEAQPARPIDKAERDAAMEEIARDAETPYMDAKYFDLDSYLEHSQGTKGRKVSDKAKSASVPGRRSNGLPVTQKAKSTTDFRPKAPTEIPQIGVVVSAATKRARKLLPKLSVVAENEVHGLLGDNSSPPKTPGGSDNEIASVKAKDKYELQNKAGIPKPTNVYSHLSSRKWQPIEDSYMLLFYKKVLSVVERGYNIRAPGPTPFTEAFNNFFVGKVIASGLPACEPRGEPSTKGKLQMTTGELKAMRDTTRGLLEGKKGGSLYVPVITQQELEDFMADGTVQADDPNDESKNHAKSPKRKREVNDVADMEGKRPKQ